MNSTTKTVAPFSADGYDTVGCFASYHPGGAHFAFGDGRVDFVSEDISIDTYRAASTRDNGDSDDNYKPKVTCP
jgi:prepilin-type processing-associated H-X9-DG protein